MFSSVADVRSHCSSSWNSRKSASSHAMVMMMPVCKPGLRGKETSTEFIPLVKAQCRLIRPDQQKVIIEPDHHPSVHIARNARNQCVKVVRMFWVESVSKSNFDLLEHQDVLDSKTQFLSHS